MNVELPDPLPRMTYHEAVERFGIDRPDLRIPLELVEVGDLVRGIFVGASNKVYKRNGGTFELDTTVYKQCNPKTGASLPGARPLIPSPRG